MSITFTHPRTEWEDPNLRVWATNAFEWSDVDLFVIHYTAAVNLPDGDPGETTDLRQYMRNMQRDYCFNRDAGGTAAKGAAPPYTVFDVPGYSVGYNIAHDWRGHTWQLRGDSFECAANAGINPRAFANLVLVDGQSGANPSQITSIRRTYAEAKELCGGRELTIIGHREGIRFNPEATRTHCPGDGIMAQIDNRLFYPVTPTPPPPPPPPPPPTGGPVKYQVVAGDSWWRITAKIHAEGANEARWKALAAANGNTELHPGMLINVPGKANW